MAPHFEYEKKGPEQMHSRLRSSLHAVDKWYSDGLPIASQIGVIP